MPVTALAVASPAPVMFVPLNMSVIFLVKSGKQRRAELKIARASKREAVSREVKLDRLRNKVLVRSEKLRPTNSYDTPRFVELGFYEDIAFVCKDCGKEEVWRDTQQKWWYEVMKGDVWTTAIRCRPCRTRERNRKNDARRVHQEGIASSGKT